MDLDVFRVTLGIILLWGVMAASVVVLVLLYLRSELSEDYRVAVIGFSRSGKTTLITASYREIRATITAGSDTAERVDKNIALLEEGRPVGPTQDQTRFMYRTDIKTGRLLKKAYKVEVGDFKGKQSENEAQSSHDHAEGSSEDLSEQSHQAEFQEWMQSAKAFIFVIDVAQCFWGYEKERGINKDYVQKMTRDMLSIWRTFVNKYVAGPEKARSYPLVLAFTKCDLVNHVNELDTSVSEKMRILGGPFEEVKQVPWNVRINRGKLQLGKNMIKSAFEEVRTYLQDSVRNNYHEVFTSSVGVEVGEGLMSDKDIFNEPRLGINELLKAVLPADKH